MHNSSFDVVSIERPSNFVVNLVVDERNAERELVSRPFVRFCSRVPAVRVLSLLDHVGCNGTELHPQSVHHTVHPQIMSWQESSDLSLKVSPHVRRGARLRKKKEEERSGDGRHGYKMATVAMVIISDGRHGYKMATDA